MIDNNSKKEQKIATRGIRIIDKIRIDTFKTTISSYATLEIEAGTNGECGGDTGHGSRTYIRLKDLGSTDIRFEVSLDARELKMVLGGDSELNQIQRALALVLKFISVRQAQEQAKNAEVLYL